MSLPTGPNVIMRDPRLRELDLLRVIAHTLLPCIYELSAFNKTLGEENVNHLRHNLEEWAMLEADRLGIPPRPKICGPCRAHTAFIGAACVVAEPCSYCGFLESGLGLNWERPDAG